MIQIKKIGIKQTAKFFAVFYFLISLVFVLPIFFITLLVGSIGGKGSSGLSAIFGGALIIFMPILYAILGFVGVAASSFAYNLIAKRIGGVEIEFDSKDESKITTPQNTTDIPTTNTNIQNITTPPKI